jgi:hypothetical protein
LENDDPSSQSRFPQIFISLPFSLGGNSQAADDAGGLFGAMRHSKSASFF